MTLPLIRPDLSYGSVAADLEAIIESGILTGGPYVARLEATVAERVGTAHAVATTSATTALHLSLAALDIGVGDEVLVSDFTFPASGNVIIQLGAVPVMVDSLPDAFALDPADATAKVTDRTKAIMPVDPFGQPADLTAMAALAEAHDLVVVEDAACALGSSRDGVACGGWPWPTCFSFHPRKVVTTGEGGAVTTDDPDLAERLARLRSHGGVRAEVGLSFVENGFNYRLSEIPSALGLEQLARLDAIVRDRQATAARYEQVLASCDGVGLRTPGPTEVWSYQSFVVMLDDDVDRDAVVAALRVAGIETTLGTYAMHAHPAFARFGYRPGDLPHSWRNQCQSLTLPLLPGMSIADVDRVATELAAAVAPSRRDAAHG